MKLGPAVHSQTPPAIPGSAQAACQQDTALKALRTRHWSAAGRQAVPKPEEDAQRGQPARSAQPGESGQPALSAHHQAPPAHASSPFQFLFWAHLAMLCDFKDMDHHCQACSDCMSGGHRHLSSVNNRICCLRKPSCAPQLQSSAPAGPCYYAQCIRVAHSSTAVCRSGSEDGSELSVYQPQLQLPNIWKQPPQRPTPKKDESVKVPIKVPVLREASGKAPMPPPCK